MERFKTVLSEFRGLSIWAFGGSATIPFVADAVGLSPPWPRGIVVATALVELVSLVIVFQLLASKGKRVVTRVIIVSAAVLALVCIVYMGASSFYTYEAPNSRERLVKGFVCTGDALRVYAAKCPYLGLEELNDSQYEAHLLWTEWSIAGVRLGLVSLWSAAFGLLSVLLGSFLVFQTKTPRARSPKIPQDQPQIRS
jgi:hypothetical protein